MLLVGERINTSIPSVAPKVEARDADFICEIARAQVEAGANMIDVNAGTFLQEECEVLKWIVELVQGAVDVPLCIDSPNPAAIEAALEICKRKPLVSSLSAEKARYQAIAPLVKAYGTSVVALCMDEGGVPATAEERARIGKQLVEMLTADGISEDDIYLDVMVRPIGVEGKDGAVALDTISAVKEAHPKVHTICGLSNVSFGLPARKVLNRTFLALAMARGLDAAILDVLDKGIMTVVYSAQALLGEDDFCMNYISAYRNGKLLV
jgi:5-methyltetrahydrofolate--homocysteine methyltransferase